jgi:hypothetical protein
MRALWLTRQECLARGRARIVQQLLTAVRPVPASGKQSDLPPEPFRTLTEPGFRPAPGRLPPRIYASAV